jgi:hypothetical protein
LKPIFEPIPSYTEFLTVPDEMLTRVLDQVAADVDLHDGDDVDVDSGLQATLALGRSALAVVAAPRDDRPLCVSRHGMQLHGAVTVDGRDRKRLERVARYLLRPPFAHDAVTALPDGRVRIHFKRPSKSGATYTTVSRDTFIARLAALVPPPRMHMVRYRGVFANRHHLRDVVAPPKKEATDKQLSLFVVRQGVDYAAVSKAALGDQVLESRPTRLGWAQLLARVFAVDVTVCRTCGGRMRVVKAVTDVDEIAAALHQARAPPRPKPSPPGQLTLIA